MKKHICGEIAYGEGVHSDICVIVTDRISDDDKAFLREAFEEFLTNFDGTDGYFHINGSSAF